MIVVRAGFLRLVNAVLPSTLKQYFQLQTPDGYNLQTPDGYDIEG